MKNEFSERLEKLGEYIFSEINLSKNRSSDFKLIDLSLGNPDDAPDKKVIQSLIEEAWVLENHRHPVYRGSLELKEGICDWFGKRFGVSLDPEREVLILSGSKQGLGLAGLVFLNKGDSALVPDPAYPVYKRSVLLAEGRIVSMPLLVENGWLPDLDGIAEKTSSKTKIIFANYPNNPTGAVAPKVFLKDLVAFAAKRDIIILSDMAYSEITFGDIRSHSILEIDAARKRTLEFFSFSKSFNMTAWRLGFVVGDRHLIDALQKARVTLDSGVFHLLQRGAAVALAHAEKTRRISQIYEKRRDILYRGLRNRGWEVDKPKGAIFIWAKPPWGCSSRKAASILRKKAGIIATPGEALGSQGEGYIRFSLTAPDEKLKEATGRLEKIKNWE